MIPFLWFSEHMSMAIVSGDHGKQRDPPSRPAHVARLEVTVETVWSQGICKAHSKAGAQWVYRTPSPSCNLVPFCQVHTHPLSFP